MNTCFMSNTEFTFNKMLCIFVIRGSHNKMFLHEGEDLSTLTVLSSAAECQLVSSNLALFSLFAMCGICLNSCFSECPTLCHPLNDV